MTDKNMDLFQRIKSLVEEYSVSEESFGDAAQLRIHPDTLEIDLVADPDEDREEFDYFLVNDLVKLNTDGSFSPDIEIIQEIAESYSET